MTTIDNSVTKITTNDNDLQTFDWSLFDRWIQVNVDLFSGHKLQSTVTTVD